MKKKLLRLFILIVVSIGLVIPAVAQAATYEISWFSVQHRTYSGGIELNKVGFSITDADTGAQIPDPTMVLSVTVTDPNGTAVTLTNRYSEILSFLSGSYDGWSNNWNYNDPYDLSDFSYDITEELIPGTYQIEVLLNDQTTLTATRDFVSNLVMPTVNSDSFKINKDDSGNLMWTWDSPMYQNLSDRSTQARAAITVYNQGDFVQLIFVTVPTNMGYLFLPAEIVTSAEALGDEFRFSQHVRETSNNNRGYSNTVTKYGSLDGGSYAPVGTTADNTPDFTWQHDDASTWYKLHLEDGSGTRIYREWYEASNICSDGKCSVSPETLAELAGGDYKWWIKSWASGGNTSWNDGTSFTLIE